MARSKWFRQTRLVCLVLLLLLCLGGIPQHPVGHASSLSSASGESTGGFSESSKYYYYSGSQIDSLIQANVRANIDVNIDLDLLKKVCTREITLVDEPADDDAYRCTKRLSSGLDVDLNLNPNINLDPDLGGIVQ